MPFPSILAGMKQPYDPSRLRIQTGDVGAFVAVTEKTGERQVALDGRSAVLAGDNVVDGVGEGREGLGQMAVFTP
jgi:hypothetical protein